MGMEHIAAVPDLATGAADLATLMQGDRPSATVYLTTQADIANAAQRSGQRWRVVRGELAGAGCPAPALAAIDSLVADAHLEGGCLAVVADEDGLVHVAHEPEVPRADIGRWDTLPSIVPLLEWRQQALAHVIVLADRTGAELVAVGPDLEEVHEHAGGARGPVAKSKPGGWSQRRFQQRAQGTWEHNAADVADQLHRLVQQVEARVVVAAGDVRAVALLQDAAPPEVAERLQVVDGTADGSSDGIADAVTRLVADASARETVAALEAWRAGLGRPLRGPDGTPAGGVRAVDGPADTLAALRGAQVATLLVHDDPGDNRRAWWGPEPSHAALTAAELAGLGVSRPVQARLVDVAVRAALLSGAGVRVVPSAGGPGGGLGAVLRWSTEP